MLALLLSDKFCCFGIFVFVFVLIFNFFVFNRFLFFRFSFVLVFIVFSFYVQFSLTNSLFFHFSPFSFSLTKINTVYYHSRMRYGNALGRVCVSVFVRLSVLFMFQFLKALTQNFTFSLCHYIFRLSKPSLYIQIIGSRSRSRDIPA